MSKKKDKKDDKKEDKKDDKKDDKKEDTKEIKERTITPYISFCVQNRPIVQREFPNMRPTDVTREVARRWKNSKNKIQTSDIITLLIYGSLTIFYSYLFYIMYNMSGHIPETKILAITYIPPLKKVYPLALPMPKINYFLNVFNVVFFTLFQFNFFDYQNILRLKTVIFG